ncbi:probable ATP-dependent DNA helicase RecS [Mercenaria mercenaria]|uniref:probable ATP-dependent DNA helicase RecS n=1 Tax=Mercenaria mercenaria TaxID=6596 RepID=UPI00234F3942|nr:probable ATP-dependent DNA helicase RecS [Mercenaria mercenaria]
MTADAVDLKSLKGLQEKAITVLISEKDCIYSLLTGYGKPLIYELLPFINHGCLVIAPLYAIIKQQVQKLCGMAMSMQWIGYGYEMARQLLSDRFYAGDKTPQSARVVMFHSSMEKAERHDSFKFTKADCCIRLIISSVVLGMGTDKKHVRSVIHAGPPTTLETYFQEIGRSGRTGTSAQAILYCNNTDLATQHMRNEIKVYCSGERCF